MFRAAQSNPLDDAVGELEHPSILLPPGGIGDWCVSSLD